MSDESLIVNKTGTIFLAGSYLVKAAIGEDIDKGQSVREFVVQVYRKRKWETIISGTSIGHKFIKLLPVPVSCEKEKNENNKNGKDNKFLKSLWFFIYYNFNLKQK